MSCGFLYLNCCWISLFFLKFFLRAKMSQYQKARCCFFFTTQLFIDFFEDKICKTCYINTLLQDALTTRSPHCGLFCQNDQKYCFPSFLRFLPLFQLKENKWARAWYRHTGALSGAGNDLLFLVFLRFPAARAQILSMAKGELSTPWDGITSEGKGVALCAVFFTLWMNGSLCDVDESTEKMHWMRVWFCQCMLNEYT